MYIPSVLILGNGYLGQRLGGALSNAQVAQERVICVRDTAVMFQKQGTLPDVVINCIKHRGSVKNEDDPHAVLESNVTVPLVLAAACRATGAFLIHLSTDCVFTDPKPGWAMWTEDDTPQPIDGLYARSKAAADLALWGLENVAIVRFRSAIDHVPSPRNFLDRLAAFHEVADVEYSITFMEDLVLAVQAIAAQRQPGVYHVFNPGLFSHRTFLLRYANRVDAKHSCRWSKPNLTVELRAAGADRVFAPSKNLERLGVRLRSVEQATEETFEKYAANLRRRSTRP